MASIQWFFMYFLTGVLMLAAFARLYIFTTPYDERVHIAAGKKAPAIALIGAMLGFTIPILTMSYHGARFTEYVLWSMIAGGVQLICFKVLYRIMPGQIEEDNSSVAILYGGSAVCIGLINAFSLIP
jgi:putative membrane protein